MDRLGMPVIDFHALEGDWRNNIATGRS